MNSFSLTFLVVYLTCASFINAYYPMVVEYGNQCETRLMTFAFSMSRVDCQKITGTRPNVPDCKFNLCQVPQNGLITRSEQVWGIASAESARKFEDVDKVNLSYLMMLRRDCEKLTGKPVLREDEVVICPLSLVRQTISNSSKLTDIMPFAGTGECPSKVASTFISWNQINGSMCRILNGTVNPEGPRKGCEFDLCNPLASQCIPTDGWNNVQMCINNSTRKIKCVIIFEEGVANTQSTSSTESTSVGVSVTADVSADIAGLFSAGLSTTVSGDFSWSDTTGDQSTWTETSKHTMEVPVNPGMTMQIQQLVGSCGNIRVKTRNLMAVEHANSDIMRTNKRVTPIITRRYR